MNHFRKSRIFPLLLLLTAIMTIDGSTGSTTLREDLPNILMIFSDDHSYPYLGCYGNEDMNTPNLDRLAAEGARLNHFYTAASQCVPSRASMLSGRSVIDIRMSRFSAPLPRAIKTIPDYLRKKGYFTGICGRSYHLDGSGRKPQETIDAFEKHELVTFPDRVDFIKKGPDDQVFGIFREFLAEVPDNRPFFLWMNYSDPHRHFTAPEYAPDPDAITVPPNMPDIPEVRADLAEHIGEINRLDMHIGLVLEEMADRGLAGNTLILFMGDNGAALLRGKGTLYDMGIHVPLIARWPERITAGQVSDILLSGEDVLPTILDAAGMEPDEEVTGKSFLPALLDQPYAPHDYIFAQRGPHSSGLPLHTGYFDLIRTVFDHEYKLIYNITWQLPYEPIDFRSREPWTTMDEMHENRELDPPFDRIFFSVPRPMFELYDRKKDPYELNNLIEDPALEPVIGELKARLHEWMIINQDYAPLPIPPPRRN